MGVPEPSVTEPTLWKHQVSALFRLRPSGRPDSGIDSPALPPLHSASAKDEASSRCIRSAGCKLSRQSRTARSLPKTPMAARLRPAKTAALWARCFACRPGQDLSDSRETDQLCFAALTNRPASLTRPSWSETSSSGYTRNCRSRPCTLASQFSRSALPQTQSDWLRAIATAPEHRPADPASSHRLRGGLA